MCSCLDFAVFESHHLKCSACLTSERLCAESSSYLCRVSVAFNAIFCDGFVAVQADLDASDGRFWIRSFLVRPHLCRSAHLCLVLEVLYTMGLVLAREFSCRYFHIFDYVSVWPFLPGSSREGRCCCWRRGSLVWFSTECFSCFGRVCPGWWWPEGRVRAGLPCPADNHEIRWRLHLWHIRPGCSEAQAVWREGWHPHLRCW